MTTSSSTSPCRRCCWPRAWPGTGPTPAASGACPLPPPHPAVPPSLAAPPGQWRKEGSRSWDRFGATRASWQVTLSRQVRGGLSPGGPGAGRGGATGQVGFSPRILGAGAPCFLSLTRDSARCGVTQRIPSGARAGLLLASLSVGGAPAPRHSAFRAGGWGGAVLAALASPLRWGPGVPLIAAPST